MNNERPQNAVLKCCRKEVKIQLKIICERETKNMPKYDWKKENITEQKLLLIESDMM